MGAGSFVLETSNVALREALAMDTPDLLEIEINRSSPSFL
jgi:hypothetical protein